MNSLGLVCASSQLDDWRIIARIIIVCLLVFILWWCGSAIAQQAEESSGDPIGRELGEVDQEEETTPDQTQLVELFKKINEQNKEISFLLGRVEELEHQVQVLREENRERYAELDERVRVLSGQATIQLSTDNLGDNSTEGGLFNSAIVLIEGEQYDEAIVKLEEMIETFPNGQRVPDGFYWLGELYSRDRTDSQALEKARQNLVQLLRLYSEHKKVAAAMYRLGVIYEDLGDSPTSLEYLERVIEEFPDSREAKLAEDYINTLIE
ncbi:MAG: tetratricopeptide repeat protein [Gammaproteobacteria bacterium]|nr:tetratricopeptide repeat protein [Gammaproteobacteria bacterium]